MTDWTRATFLDLTSATALADPTGTSVTQAYGFTPADISAAGEETMLVGLVLPRANDPAALLDLSWGERQEALAELGEAVFDVYGADEAAFANAIAILDDLGIAILGPEDGFLIGAETRTIWVDLDAEGFSALFGQELLKVNETGALFWEGALSEPAQIALAGLAVSADIRPATEPLVDETVTLPQGPQSIGNSATHVDLTADDIAALYNFPLLSDEALAAVTTTVGLIEPGIGSALGDGDTRTFQEAVEEYLAAIDRPQAISTYTLDAGSQTFDGGSGERSLDVGIVAAVNPYGRIGLYNGAANGLFQTYQSAIFDSENDPSVLSSSFGEGSQPSADSPFKTAYLELFTDAALANRTVFIASGDGGSSSAVGAGVPRVGLNESSPYIVSVGGTSLSLGETAASDPTLAGIVEQFRRGDPPVIWDLVAGGLKAMPGSLEDDDVFLEAVWNQYVLTGNELDRGYLVNATGTGGVDTGVETPGYQSDYGLSPTGKGPLGGIGRGLPDVSGNAGGNLFYSVPDGAFQELGGNGGTSASTPLWASLFQQVNTIFKAEGLPRLGYSNDLLYQAAAIAPASFNDVQLGNNVSTFIEGSTYETPTRSGETATIDATGIGYTAGEGYDLATGLGTPNGALLSEALSAIAHRELTGEGPGVLVDAGEDARSAIDQTLAIQVRTNEEAQFTVSTDGESDDFTSNATEDFAWTARFAQQSLQADFDPALVRLFDTYEQGALEDATFAQGDTVTVTLDGEAPTQTRAPLTNDFGFVEYADPEREASLTLSRVVAVADTTRGADDQDFMVHTRQNSGNSLELAIYRVDDFEGRIDDLLPGEDGYAQAAATRAYETTQGDDRVDGAGFGEYAAYRFTGVDNGDLIAMTLFTANNTFWSFSEENRDFRGEKLAHLWNYGHNTWGFEDAPGGGDRDFNDLVVQFDFTGTDLLA